MNEQEMQTGRAEVVRAELRRELEEMLKRDGLFAGSMRTAQVSIGFHVGAVIVFGETQFEADRRALKLAAAWNAVVGLPTLETREVLAACYLGPNKGGSMLSHSVEVGERGSIIQVLCDRVSPQSIADAGAADITGEPTCKTCLSRRKKWTPSSSR